MVESPNVHERGAAAKFFATKSTRVTDHLVTLVGDKDAGVRALVKPVLVEMAEGTDFGPPQNATDAERTEAVKKWRRWQQERTILEDLGRAKALIGRNPEAARRRLETVLRESPDTAAAGEVRALLARLDAAPTPAADGDLSPDETTGAARWEPTDEQELVAEAKLRAVQKMASGDRQMLCDLLEDLVKQYPGTKAAKTAASLLRQNRAESETGDRERRAGVVLQ
jgi:hypothetical protein